MRMLPALVLAPLVLAACTPSDMAESGGGADPAVTRCGSDKAARFVGQVASADVRAQVARAVGHDRIRWIAPDTVVTMDFSETRLNADLDAAGKITGFRCG